MIRHGQASFGSENYDCLSQKGELQSRVLAEHLLAAGVCADALYSGEMKRQIDTAARMVEISAGCHNAVPVSVVDSAFNEYCSQEIIVSFVQEIIGEDPLLKDDLLQAYHDKKKFQVLFEAVLSGWATGKYKKEGLDTWDKFAQRVWNGLARIMENNSPGKTILIFTSGGPISAALQKALGLSNKDAIRLGWQLANASLTRFVFTKDRFTLASFNETAYLALHREMDLITYR